MTDTIISHGIGFGFVSFVTIQLLRGKAKGVHPLLYGISAAFVLMFLLPVLQRWFA